MIAPTNRFNLLEVLSSGLMGPRASYDKYYPDLLEMAPGRIVLVGGRVDQAIERCVSRAGAGAFPVAIELSGEELKLDQVDAMAPPVKRPGDFAAQGSAYAWAPRTVLPTTLIRAIHFRSSDELNEFRQRDHRNVPASEALHVSPEVFGAEGVAGLERWLGSLMSSERPSKDEIFALDKEAGALALLLFTTSREQAMLEEGPNSLAPLDPREILQASLPHWVYHHFRPGGSQCRQLEARIFSSSIETFTSLQPWKRWRPLEVLGVIREKLSFETPEAMISVELDNIEAVLKNEVELTSLSEPPQSASIAAILPVLVRPQPERLLPKVIGSDWARSAVGATATAYAGALWGFKRLAAELKPSGIFELLSTYLAKRIDSPDRVWN